VSGAGSPKAFIKIPEIKKKFFTMEKESLFVGPALSRQGYCFENHYRV
jgi:hypothetical protein